VLDPREQLLAVADPGRIVRKPPALVVLTAHERGELCAEIDDLSRRQTISNRVQAGAQRVEPTPSLFWLELQLRHQLA
jgi:hypothetical protein